MNMFLIQVCKRYGQHRWGFAQSFFGCNANKFTDDWSDLCYNFHKYQIFDRSDYSDDIISYCS